MDSAGVGNASGEAKKEPAGQSYNYSDQELIRRLVKSRMAQKQQLEYEDLDGYVLPPRTQFSMLKKPAVTIKYGRMTFNMACIRLFESVQHILPLIHPEKKKMTIVTCAEEESASVQWARIRSTDGEWVNRDITSDDFIHNIYKMMGWKLGCRYKALGRVANSREGLVLVFELEEAVMFASKPVEIVNEETGEVKKKQVKYYPDAYKDVIGKSYNDYVEARQMNLFEYLEDYVGQTYSDRPQEEEQNVNEGNEILTQSDLSKENETQSGYGQGDCGLPQQEQPSIERPADGGGGDE